MDTITKNEMQTILSIVKSPEMMYNANNLAKVLEITSMGTLKILKKLEQELILKSKQIGKARIYRINLDDDYSKNYINLLLSREALHSSPQIKRWASELKKIKHADLIILFGSVLDKKEPIDIDVLFVTEQKNFKKLKDEIKELNQINVKNVHPVYQSKEDLILNIKEKDKVILNAIKGIFIKGENNFLEVYDESRKE